MTEARGFESEKLSQLRAKTDRQLVDFLQSKLVSAVESLENVEQAAIETKRLLPVLNEEQRRALDPKLAELQETLERLRFYRETPKCIAAGGC